MKNFKQTHPNNKAGPETCINLKSRPMDYAFHPADPMDFLRRANQLASAEILALLEENQSE